jgi:hypothetical protein
VFRGVVASFATKPFFAIPVWMAMKLLCFSVLVAEKNIGMQNAEMQLCEIF